MKLILLFFLVFFIICELKIYLWLHNDLINFYQECQKRRQEEVDYEKKFYEKIGIPFQVFLGRWKYQGRNDLP